MRTILLAGTAAGFALLATTGARAETIYVTEPDAGYVSDESDYVVSDRSYVVTEPRTVVVEPRRERIVVVPRRERNVVIERPAREREVVIERPATTYVAPRDGFTYRGTWRGGGGYVSTAYSSGGSCIVDSNGFERCY
jgi:hypothetical protein